MNANVERVLKNLDRGIINPKEAEFQLIELYHHAKCSKEELDAAIKEVRSYQ